MIYLVQVKDKLKTAGYTDGKNVRHSALYNRGANCRIPWNRSCTSASVR